MSSCVGAVLISLACDKHLSFRQLTHNHSLPYITGKKVSKQIEDICKDIPIISEHTRDNQSANIRRKLKRIMKRCKDTSKQ